MFDEISRFRNLRVLLLGRFRHFCSLRRPPPFSPSRTANFPLTPHSASFVFDTNVATPYITRKMYTLQTYEISNEFQLSPKDFPHHLSSKGDYRNPYSCETVHIGKIDRSIKTIVLDHQCYLKSGPLQTAIAEHQHATGHSSFQRKKFENPLRGITSPISGSL